VHLNDESNVDARARYIIAAIPSTFMHGNLGGQFFTTESMTAYLAYHNDLYNTTKTIDGITYLVVETAPLGTAGQKTVYFGNASNSTTMADAEAKAHTITLASDQNIGG
jgi:hypothetical protein